MYNIVSKLIIYGDMDKDSILMKLSENIRKQIIRKMKLSPNYIVRLKEF